VATVAIAVSAGALLGPIVGPAGADGFVLVGTHPQASQQSTARGRTLNFLKHWNGKIYAGYGDYGTNTGPIAITPFDPATNTFSQAPFWADTEELQVFRALNGNLYAPSIDTRVGADYSHTTPSGPWLSHDVVPSIHVFDMATLTGSDLWMVGSAGEYAVAWRSLDGGNTWTEALAVPPVTQGAGDFARFYFAGAHHDRLYVQAVDAAAGTQPASRVFDGSSWSTGPSLLSPSFAEGYDTEPFNGRMVYLMRQSSLTALRSFDGTAVSAHSPPYFYNYSVDGSTLYALGTDGVISTTTDLVRWTTLEARAPITARSIVVINGVIYVGTTDSRIYRYDRPSAAPPGPPPPGTSPPGASPPPWAGEAASELSLKQQVGQLLIGSFNGSRTPRHTRSALRSGRLSGVILFRSNVGSRGRLRALSTSLQRAARGTALISVDQEGGLVRRIPFAGPRQGQPSQGSVARVRRLAVSAGRTLRRLGVNVNFAPVADVPSGQHADIYRRGFRGSPSTVARKVVAATRGYRRARVAATAKHFPGLGAARRNTDNAGVVIPRSARRLRRIDLVPFRSAIAADVPLVMVAHALYPALDRRRVASQSRKIVTRLLRARLGYQGAVVTDALEARAIRRSQSVAAAAERSLLAGCDLLLLTHPASLRPVLRRLIARARGSSRVRNRLRESVARVLVLKQSLGLRLPEPPAP
jgi:beta-N-acetylhexosaminidase